MFGEIQEFLIYIFCIILYKNENISLATIILNSNGEFQEVILDNKSDDNFAIEVRKLNSDIISIIGLKGQHINIDQVEFNNINNHPWLQFNESNNKVFYSNRSLPAWDNCNVRLR